MGGINALRSRFAGGGNECVEVTFRWRGGGMNALRSRFVGGGNQCVEVSFRGWGE